MVREEVPGLVGVYGKFWEAYAEMSDPAKGTLPLSLFDGMPPLCRVCHLPVALPRPDLSRARIKTHDGRKHAFCSDGCEQIFAYEPARFAQNHTFDEHYHGYSLVEYIEHAGLVRNDGKTMLAQPHLNEDKRWTLDDIRRSSDFVIKDPLREMAAEGPVEVLQ